MLEYHSIFYRKYEWGRGQSGGKNHNHAFVLTSFNFFGRFNIFPTYAGVNIRVSSYQPIEIVMRSYDPIDRQVAY
jgi:hypothetical protein